MSFPLVSDANLSLLRCLGLQSGRARRGRRKKALKAIGFAANLLQPVYRGSLLSTEQAQEAEAFLLENLDATGATSLKRFLEKEGPFRQLYEKKIEDPTSFWYFVRRSDSELARVALRLLKIPASSAQLERLFSNWSFVHSEARNRLKPEKSKKLVGVYYALKNRDQACSDY